MTLYRQIVLVVVVLSILMFAGTAVINVNDTRNYLVTQLESHAQDTATSLGLSLSPHMADRDDAQMIAMIDAIFDRGYYQDITLRTIDGTVIWSRHSDKNFDDVPIWLIDLVQLQGPEATAIIMSGWQQAGNVFVKSHPGIAYSALWHTITTMLWWFSGLMIVLLLLAAVAVRLLLKPLERLEVQALAVSDRHFDEISEVPKTRELRNLVTAMNYMTSRVKQMFTEQAESTEQLRSMAFQDTLTGLHNRRYFDAALNTLLSDTREHHEGALFLVQLLDLQSINQRLGFDAADDLLKATAEKIRKSVAVKSDAVLARLSGGDFAIIIEHLDETEAKKTGDDICRYLLDLHVEDFIDTEDVCLVGIAMFTTGMAYSEVLSRADNALQAARSQGMNSCAVYVAPEQMKESVPGRQAWQDIVKQAVASKGIVLHAQPVTSAQNMESVLHREILLRLPGPDDVLWSAGMFLPVAEQIGLARELDQIVIKNVISQPAVVANEYNLAVNISAASLHESDFITWLENVLSESCGTAGSIIFEVAESTIVRDLEHVQALADLIRQYGFGFAVDHFGRGMNGFGYLQSLRPDYVKIDSLYMNNIASSQDDQFFVSSLCKVAHSLDIVVIAEAVENDEQLAVLQSLGVDGVQGFGIARPAAL